MTWSMRFFIDFQIFTLFAFTSIVVLLDIKDQIKELVQEINKFRLLVKDYNKDKNEQI